MLAAARTIPCSLRSTVWPSSRTAVRSGGSSPSSLSRRKFLSPVWRKALHCRAFCFSGRIAAKIRRSCGLGAKAICATGAGFRDFLFAVLWRGMGFERGHELHRGCGDLVDGGLKGFFVCLGRLIEAANLAHELERGVSNLGVGDGRFEVEEHLDVSAHG